MWQITFKSDKKKEKKLFLEKEKLGGAVINKMSTGGS